MKSIIIYYSYTGKTQSVAKALEEYLKPHSQVDIISLKDLGGLDTFFKQGQSAFKHKRTLIEKVNFDLGSYDLICFGTPVWAFTSTPVINTYLDACLGVQNKKVVLFTTSGGMGDSRAIKYMQELLSRKGAKEFFSFSVPQAKTGDKEMVLSRIKSILPLWPNG